MKKLILALMAILILAFGAAAVSAAVTVQETFSATNPLLGGRNQEASNPAHDDAVNKIFDVYDEGTFTLANSNVADVTFIIAFPSGFGFSRTDINLSKVSTEITIPGNGTAPVTIRGRIPEKLDAVNTNLQEVAFQVGTATITPSDGSGVLVMNIFMQRENFIEIQDVDVEINDQNRQNVDDDDNLDKLKPGDRLDFEVTVENNADKDSNLEVQDTEVKFECSDEEDLDIDEDDSDQDIAEDDEETFDFQVVFDDDAADGSTRCDLKAEGKDKWGARHGEEISFDLEVERESHDINIKSASVNPAELSCTDKSFQVNVEMMNLGRSDEDDAAVEIEARTLDYNKKISNIDLEEDDSRTEVFDIPIPDDLESGAHLIQVRTFYDGNKASDSEVVQVNNVCGAAAEQPEQPSKGAPAVSVAKTQFTAQPGDLVSVQVRVTNTANTLRTFTVRLDEVGDFAENVASKSLTLNRGQTSTAFLNVRIKDDAREGDYSALVNVESNGQPVASESVVFEVAGEAAPGKKDVERFVGSTAFWVIIDVLLIVAAIVILWLIFRRKE